MKEISATMEQQSAGCAASSQRITEASLQVINFASALCRQVGQAVSRHSLTIASVLIGVIFMCQISGHPRIAGICAIAALLSLMSDINSSKQKKGGRL